jgi:PAS domain S-box-containing protein
MFVTAILGLSVLLQFIAAALAIRLIRTTGKRLAWTLIAAAILLMAVRRFVTLYHALAGDPLSSPEPKAELVALVISILMVVGVARMGAFFTGVRRLQNSLGASEEQARALYEYSPLMYFTVDTNGIILDINRCTVEELGYGREELIGKPVTDIFVEDDRPKAREQLASCLYQPHHPSFWELRTRAKDGSVVWVRETAFPLRAADGATVVRIACENITEWKRAEETLKRSEAGLARAQRIAHVGSWDWDIEANRLRWSDETYRIFGLAPESFEATYEAFLECIHPDDREHISRAVDEARYEGKPYAIDHRIVLPDGGERIVHEEAEVVYGEDGEPLHMHGTVQDITGRVQTERALEESELRFQAVADHVPGIVYRRVLHPDGTISYSYLSAGIRHMYGLDPEAAKTDFGQVLSIIHPDDRPRFLEALHESAAALSPLDIEFRQIKPDGAIVWIRSMAQPRHMENGEVVWDGIALDVTENKTAMEALQASERRLSEAQQIAHVGSWEWNVKKNILTWSDETYRIFGREPGSDISVERFRKQVHPEDLDHVLAIRDAAFRNETPYDLEYRIIRTDGSVRHLHSAGKVELDAQKQPIRLYGSVYDITEHKLAEAAVRKSEARYRMLVETMNDGVAIVDTETRFTYVNNRFANMLGRSKDEILGRPAHEFADERNGKALERQINKRRRGETEAYEMAWLRGDGTTIFTLISPQPILDESGHFRGSFGIFTDITERKRAEDEIRRSEEHLRLVTDALPVVISYIDSGLRFRFANKLNEEWLARPRSEIIGRRVRDVINKSSYEKVHPYRKRALSGEEVRFEEKLAWPDGKIRHVQAHYVPHVSPTGSHLGYFSLMEDITERKAAEAELFQAQKMQAVGQLTGGVAHDFNNLLTIVIGNLDILKRRIRRPRAGQPNDKQGLNTQIEEIAAAAKRGAELTQRLLAFSRKQPLQPERVDLNRLTQRMSTLLQRAIGERIKLETVIHAGLWPATADPVQVENAILNLTLNAKDAMPEGGRLTIETANVRIGSHYAEVNEEIAPGQYVLLAVTDTGAGMSPEVVKRAFEPFFTTKIETGGSGLGLSTIYGFVKQSKGHVKIYTEVGKGTTVKIYLPKAKGGKPRKARRQKPATAPHGGGETILVVEDDPSVREVTVVLLEGLGYRVFEAENGPAALAVLERKSQIDLMLADIVMPGGLKADELMRKAQAQHPGLKVLFMSGYTENAIVHNGVLDEGVRLLVKPFEEHDLDREIRSLLNRKEDGS